MGKSVRDWVSLREVGLVCMRLDESVRDFWESVRSWVSL